MKTDKTRDNLFVKVVRAGKRLTDKAMLPDISARNRKSELVQRCALTAKSIDPNVETTITKLSKVDQYKIRCIFGSADEVYKGCLSDTCLDYDTTEWFVTDLSTKDRVITISRCKRCYTPKSFRRRFDCWALWDTKRPCDCDGCARALKKRRGM